MASPAALEPVVPSESSADTFQPSKKRKFYRQRRTSRSPSPSSTLAPISPPPPAQTLDDLIASTSQSVTEDAEVEGTAVSMAEILRLRKMRRLRGGGVEFTVEMGGKGRDRERDAGEHALVRAGDAIDPPPPPPPPVVRRFAPQTGMVGDVDRHMMAYIDSELAKRSHDGSQTLPHLPTAQPHSSLPAATTTTTTSTSPPPTHKNLDIHRQPTTRGKLLEIDLGSEARDRNVQRTEKARRRLDGEDVEDEDGDGDGDGDERKKKKVVKVRLGPDGKPWRGGRRKRRGSDDVKRDQLVEEVLRENRLEIYEPPAAQPLTATSASGPSDDQAADDRIADAFRKEFMDAVSARQRKKSGPAPPPSRGPGGKKEEEVLKGPKLGGSRSARAAVREALLKEARKGG